MAEAAIPKPCPRCGQPAEVKKSGSNRWWVQCAKFGKDGNCKAISTICPSKPEAIRAWNAVK